MRTHKVGMPSLSILLVDDHELVRRGLRSLLSSRADWFICGEAADGFDAVEKAKSLRPDVVVMDLTMPRMDGMQAARIIHREMPESAVVIISQNDPILGRRLAAEANAQAFVAKEDASRDLLSTIDALFDFSKTGQHKKA